VAVAAVLAGLGASGCGIAPHSFRALTHPAPIVRARSIAFGDRLPEEKVVPALIARLNDSDPVVRLTAHAELRERTRQDFGYVPWAPGPEREAAVAKWQGWWQQRKVALARSRQKP
jgi:hypothetical protein